MAVPVITVAQMREWEKATWAAGPTEAEVIRRVGLAVARRALELTRSNDLILVLAGKGHNGDDARAACEHLWDRRVTKLDIATPQNDLPKLEQALQPRPALIIDGLFGIGLDRPLDDSWKKLIETVNRSKVPVLAIDVPSGLDAETGQPQGASIEAAVTLTVGAPKAGLLVRNAWPFVGRLEVAADVGLVPCPFTGELNWTLPEDFIDFPPRRPVEGHKGSFGHVGIVAGSLGFHGASVLAARAAQRAQPGLVTLFTQEEIYHAVASQLQAVMVNVWTRDTRLPETTSAILIGPGLAAPQLTGEMRNFTRRFWRDLRFPMVVDASVLDLLVAETYPKEWIRVLTPHPGEAARLLNTTSQQVQANRVQALRNISRQFGNAWVVLKGHQTLVGRSSSEIFVNSSGNPHLAQGGSGDVLAGFIAGLLAQPALLADVGKTIRYAVWRHGAAADRLSVTRPGWVVEDLIGELGNAL